jgi:Peptidase S24-like
MRPSGSIPEILAVHAQKSELVSQVLLANGTARIRALGTSMLPTIWPGDILVIEPISHDRLVHGDVIAVKTLRGIRVHRLINKDGWDWITHGDAMPQNDPAISPEQVLGRVSEIRRGQQVTIPARELRLLQRVCAWMLGHSLVCRMILRLRSATGRARPDETLQLRHQKLVS